MIINNRGCLLPGQPFISQSEHICDSVKMIIIGVWGGGEYLAREKDKLSHSSKKTDRQKNSRTDQSKVTKNRKSAETVSMIILKIMFAALLLLLLISPFYRGLFFTQDLLVAQAFIFALLILWGLYRHSRQEQKMNLSPLDLCLMVLLLAYIGSFFFAAHKRAALEEILKIASYLVIYLVSIELFLNFYYKQREAGSEVISADTTDELPPGLNLILHLLIVVTVVITIASLGVAAGHWAILGAYHDAGLRIASPMGYANTAAAYFMAAYLLVVAIAPLAGKLWSRALYLAPATLILLTTILTFSRGAWLLLLPLIILLVIASAPGQRLRSMLYVIASAVAALPAAFLADPIFRSDQPSRAWLPIIIAILCAILLGFLAEIFLKQNRNFKLATGGIIALVVVTALIFMVVLPLSGPVELSYLQEGQGERRAVEQVVENVGSRSAYQITFDIMADQADSVLSEWELLVFGGLPSYRSIELFSYQGRATSSWEQQGFTFQTDMDISRLEIRFSLLNPETNLKLKEVKLVADGEEKSLNFALNRILPGRYYDRIFSQGRDRNLDARLEMFRDALKIIKDYPLTGKGGGGWNALYQGYQDRSYFSSEVHNHFLQVWVEAGIFGFLAFIGLWASLAIAFIRNCFLAKADTVRWQHWTAVFLPVAALGAHSIIDWNFSMAAVGIYLFVLLGAGKSLDQIKWFKGNEVGEHKKQGRRLTGIIAIIIGLILFTGNLVLIGGFRSTALSQEYIEQRNMKMAIPELQRAISLDPLRAENYHNLGVLLEEQARVAQDSGNLENIINLARRAYELEPYNPLYIFRYGEFLLNYVDVRYGLDTIDRLIIVRPLSENSYIQAGLVRLRLAEYYLESGRPDQAEEIFKEIQEVENLMETRFGETAPLNFILGRVALLRGDLIQAEVYFMAVKEGEPFYELAQQQLQILTGAEKIE